MLAGIPCISHWFLIHCFNYHKLINITKSRCRMEIFTLTSRFFLMNWFFPNIFLCDFYVLERVGVCWPKAHEARLKLSPCSYASQSSPKWLGTSEILLEQIWTFYISGNLGLHSLPHKLLDDTSNSQITVWNHPHWSFRWVKTSNQFCIFNIF